MAKVIRKVWVHRKQNRWWRYLPRRNDYRLKFNYDEGEGSLDSFFEERMPVEPPKLWVAWLYKDLYRVPRELRALFGDDPKAGTLGVFKNTYSTNKTLWKFKHIIDIRPMTFPNGEPIWEDIGNVEIMHDGRCIIDKELAPDPQGIELYDPLKQFKPAYLGSRLISRYIRFKDVYEDNVYNPSNITIID